MDMRFFEIDLAVVTSCNLMGDEWFLVSRGMLSDDLEFCRNFPKIGTELVSAFDCEISC